MELIGVIKDGKVELPTSVRLPEGAAVRVIVEIETPEVKGPFESEPVEAASVQADIDWATGHRFDS